MGRSNGAEGRKSRPAKKKIVIRNLPVQMDLQSLQSILKPFEKKYSWSYFRPGKSSIFPSRNRPGLAYLYFPNPSDIFDIVSFVQAGNFVFNEKVIKPQVEYAPSQSIPRKNLPKDNRQGRYDTDVHYLNYIKSFEENEEKIPGTNEEEKKQSDGQEGEEIAPIVAFLAKKGSKISAKSTSKMARRSDSRKDPSYNRNLDSSISKESSKQGKSKRYAKENKGSKEKRETRRDKSNTLHSQTELSERSSAGKGNRSSKYKQSKKSRKAQQQSSKAGGGNGTNGDMVTNGAVKIIKRERTKTKKREKTRGKRGQKQRRNGTEYLE
mmetsp:Transcript_9911/g.13732  ORF Transcript_9911/g.13732 Transcript_9911/m.13732 type:complete len:323 (-) Transcript_9911:746-1714(-)